MTKSIEQQAEEYSKESLSMEQKNILKTYKPDNFRVAQEMERMAFLAGSKSRDAEWLKVVNELKDCAQDIIKNKMVHPFEYHHYSREDMVELLKSSLAKAELMMKEMGIK